MIRINPILFAAVLLGISSVSLGQNAEALARALAPMHEGYDPAEKMVKRGFSSPGYHTTLTGGQVHSTREALVYAVGCLATNEPALVKRACEVIERVIGLQDQDPKSRTYGIWSWFLEEPLAKMSPPDWNWADFNGRSLLQVRLRYWDRIPEGLKKKIDESILHAARSIQRRNVGPGYTNIAVMGTYVTLVAAETYGLADLKDYAMKRLANLRQYTEKTGGFTEYNSPTYTIVTLTCLGLLRHDVKDESARKMVEELYRLAWEEVATHFHAPTRQWAGPHSRCYSTLLKPSALALIQSGTQGRVDFGQSDAPANLELLGVELPCPKDLEAMFVSLDGPREVVKTFVKSERPIVGTTYLHPAFALGSVNRGDMWNQRRPLVAYFGDAKSPGYLQLRLLKNDYDFAAGQFFSVQKEGRVLAGMTFATDGGDTHISLKRIKDGQFAAKDLRVRFELGGCGASARVVMPKDVRGVVRVGVGKIVIQIQSPLAAFGDSVARWETGSKGPVAWVDLVLYSGGERAFDLKQMERAAVGIAVSISTVEKEEKPAEVEEREGRAKMDWAGLTLGWPIKPAKAGEMGR